MKCEKGHELKKMPYHRNYYCPICNPRMDKIIEMQKAETARKRRDRKAMRLLNKIYEKEMSGE